MLKVIPPSDIQVRPFKAYKEWQFSELSTDINLLYAEDTDTNTDTRAAVYFPSVTIGTQEWMSTNLDIKTLPNGSELKRITITGDGSQAYNDPTIDSNDWQVLENSYGSVNADHFYAYPGFDAIYPNIDSGSYGLYYDYGTVRALAAKPPAGWRMPTLIDYQILFNTLNGDSTAGGYLKSYDDTLWQVGTTRISDSGFGAQPIGFAAIEMIASFSIVYPYTTFAYSDFNWGSVAAFFAYDPTNATIPLISFSYNNNAVDFDNTSPLNMAPIRLIRDAGPFEFNKKQLYHQLKAQFYNGHEDNPFMRFGNKSNEYNADDDGLNERYLSGSAKVISIPQAYVGEGIKKNSVEIIDNFRNITYNDDGYGNLITYDTEPAQFSKLDFGTTTTGGNLNFQSSIFGNVYSASLQVSALISGSLDLNASGIMPTYQNLTFLYNSNVSSASFTTLDLNTGIANNFSSSMYTMDNSSIRNLQGNVFYAQGLITFTKNPDKVFEGQWDLTYKSTKTIYEHEYLLVVKEGEFNISTNRSAIAVVDEDSYDFTDSQNRVVRVTSYPGVNYIRKKSILENGEVLDYRYTSSYNTSVVAGFEHYDESGSIDKSGSFLTPYITTIGLYDNNADLLAVAKFPQPIKIYPDIPINFIIRFDT